MNDFTEKKIKEFRKKFVMDDGLWVNADPETIESFLQQAIEEAQEETTMYVLQNFEKVCEKKKK